MTTGGRARIIAAAAALAGLAGCASSSPFVGTWEAQTLPDGMPASTQGELFVEEEGVFIATFSSPQGETLASLRGTWEADGDAATFSPDGRVEPGRGIVGDDGRLRVSAGGESVVFERSQQ